MNNEKFFKNSKLPFVECRYSQRSIRRFKDHMHRSFSVGAVDKGSVRYSVVGDREAILTEGALAVINPEKLHSCNSINGAERSYYMLYFDADRYPKNETGWARQMAQ